MDRDVSRREFLKLTLASSAGLGLAPVAGAPSRPASGLAPGRRGGGGARSRSDRDLPPRVIGLRTLGGDFRFDPVGLRLEPGEEVIWLNMGDFHTATAFHPENDKLLNEPVPPRIPEGADSFHSGMLGMAGGTEFTYRAEVGGVYDYFCQPHYSFGMVGRFVVGRPRGGPAVTRSLSELNDASREAMPSVEAIMGPPGRGYEWASRVNGLLYLRSHREDESAATEAVRDGVEADAALADLLARTGRAGTFRRALREFLAAYGGEAGYEELVSLADRAKSPLREAVSAAT